MSLAVASNKVEVENGAAGGMDIFGAKESLHRNACVEGLCCAQGSCVCNGACVWSIQRWKHDVFSCVSFGASSCVSFGASADLGFPYELFEAVATRLVLPLHSAV